MNSNHRISCRREGSALVVVLCFVFLLSGLVVAVLIATQLDRNGTQSYYQTARAQELAKGATEEILSDLRDEIVAGSMEDSDTSKFTVSGKRIFVPTVPADPARFPLTQQPARIGFIPGTGASCDYATDVDPNNDKVPPSLVRVSRYLSSSDQDAVFPEDRGYIKAKRPVQRVSAVSSANRSANGRVISPKRWASTYLLSATPNAVPARFASNPPQWVYYSRNDSRISTVDPRNSGQVYTTADVPNLITASKDMSSQNAVVGRYAYVIYDEGGLLDMNVAGYRSTLSSSDDQAIGPGAIRGKSAQTYAALISLPGFPGANDDDKQNKINNFAKWRNQGSIDAANNSFFRATDNLLKIGFLTAKQNDNPLLSRKDLIDYFTKQLNAPQTLPYLGTFTRFLAAPTARPVTPVDNTVTPSITSTIDYAKNADSTSTDILPNSANPAIANRDLANVRFAQDGTIDHYADDATKKSYTVKAGDQLLQNRFSLARLDWLKDGNPNTGNGPTTGGTKADAIQACFGLVWDTPKGTGSSNSANGGRKCWNYIGAKGNLTNPPGTIKTLAEVAGEGREPDFFEILKAAILSGSLGKYPGPAAFENATVTTRENAPYLNPAYAEAYYYPNFTTDQQKFGVMGMYAHSFPVDKQASKNTSLPAHPVSAQVSDVQIMRIGANIVDQYDADSWPTAIYFRYKNIDANGINYDPAQGVGNIYSNPIFGSVTMIYGTENLPYIQGMRSVVAYPDKSVQSIGGWRQPCLWNPHQPSTDPSLRPTTFEVRAYGTGRTFWQRNSTATDPMHSDAFHPTYNAGESQSVDYFLTPSSDNDAVSMNRGTIRLTMTTSSKAFYGQNSPLVQDGLDGSNVTVTSLYPGNISNPTMDHYNDISVFGRANHFVGFSTGVTDPLESPPSPTKNAIPYSPIFAGAGLSSETRGGGGGAVTTYALGWIDSGNGFHPYSFLTGVFATSTFKEDNSYQYGTALPYDNDYDGWLNPDPRTERFSHGRNIYGNVIGSMSVYQRNAMGDSDYFYPCGGSVLPWKDKYNPGKPNLLGFYGQGIKPSFQQSGYDINYDYPSGDWMVNSPADPQGVNVSRDSNHKNGYYTDPDGMIRYGDGYYGNRTTGDGVMTFYSDGVPTNSNPSSTDKGAGSAITHARRPVILDRPFRSVGELGYVFRDLPFKTLDFFTDRSADTALLDVFCLRDLAIVTTDKLIPIGAGRVNLNAASAPVIKALLQNGTKKESDVNYNAGTSYAKGYNLASESDAIATAFVGKIMPVNGYAPISGYRELVPALVSATRGASSTNSTDKGNKTYLEAPIRALSESTDFRTWNLLIDVIAQSGQFSSNAKTLNDFTVQSECRVWLHVSIDRYTGEIIARQLEPVYE